MNNTVRTVVIMIVATVWAINFTAPVFVDDYTPSPELNVAFMAIIGVLTASYKMEKSSDDKSGSSTPPPPPPSPELPAKDDQESNPR